MKMQKGFTLIEIAMVILIMGVLSAVAVPKFVNLTSKAEGASVKAISNAVYSGYAIAVADLDANPTVTQLGTYISNSTVTASGKLNFTLGSKTCSAKIYTNTGCTTAPTAAANTVLCVGATGTGDCS